MVLIVIIALAVAILIWRDVRRRTSKPGALKRTGKYAFEIVGEASYQPALERLAGGRTRDGAHLETAADLILEDDNPYDNKAVAVRIGNKLVGYMSRDNAREYRHALERLGSPRATLSCGALIVGGWNRGPGDQGHFGVKLDLPLG